MDLIDQSQLKIKEENMNICGSFPVLWNDGMGEKGDGAILKCRPTQLPSHLIKLEGGVLSLRALPPEGIGTLNLPQPKKSLFKLKNLNSKVLKV